jgi:hypothetical protein
VTQEEFPLFAIDTPGTRLRFFNSVKNPPLAALFLGLPAGIGHLLREILQFLQELPGRLREDLPGLLDAPGGRARFAPAASSCYFTMNAPGRLHRETDGGATDGRAVAG